MSQAADVPLSSLDRYLAAKSEVPSLVLGRLALACNTSVDKLLFSSDVVVYGSDASEVLIQSKAKNTAADVDFVRVPFLEVRASAGRGRASVPAETMAADHLLFSRSWLRSLNVAPEDAEMLLAEGDSMSPTIKDGDMMLVDRGYGEVVHGKIYALVVNDLVVVKRINMLAIGGMMLISDNDRYPAETIRREDVDRVSFQGRIAWYGRAI
ncbi:S24 family peptidase [Methylorubrum populi]|uniref:S24 family peptidase n=1 Tax=Methylorubrum populi TaxID=223967 RepID=UPI0023574A81|nr:S24 family peptidase [Methylorubrum populi]